MPDIGFTPSQIRGARGLVGWSQQQLASAAGVGLSTVSDFEAGRREPMRNNAQAMQRALEAAGVVFLAEGEIMDGGPGVRLRKD